MLRTPGATELYGVMEHAMDIYLFRSTRFARNGDSVVCVGRRGPIESLLGVNGLEATFFGFAEYVDNSGERFLGVWGARNASRLRGLLRERGAELLVHRAEPPARLRVWETRPGVRTAVVRARRRAQRRPCAPLLAAAARRSGT